MQLEEQKLDKAYNPSQMNELDIYPSIDWAEEGQKEYIFDNLLKVVEYYKDASSKRNAMLLYIL